MLPATYLSGRRTPWQDAPVDVRRLVESWTGPVTDVRNCSGGMATGLAAVVTGEHGSVFVKALDGIDNPKGAQMYRREAEVAARLPRHRSIPAVLASRQVGDWWVTAQEAAPGRTPEHPWRPEDLDRVLAAWADLQPAVVATPWQEPAGLDAFFTAWREIAADADDPWHAMAAHWVDREERLAREITGGSEAVLAHIDLRADNLLIDDATGQVSFLDWAHPGLAARWADVAILLADVPGSGAAVETGGAIDLRETFARVEPAVDPELAVTVAAGVIAFLHLRGRAPVIENLPHRTVWARAFAEVGQAFVETHTR